jgi:hypothetical protein
MRADADKYFTGRRGLLSLWGGLLLAPIAWLLHQQSSYLLVYWACGSGRTFLFHLGTLALLLVAAAGTYLAWTAWNDSGREWADEGGRVADRSRFLALGGLLLSGLFATVIFAQWIPTFLVDPCVR